MKIRLLTLQTFLSSTGKGEIKLILSSIDISYITSPNSILTKASKLIKSDISDQLTNLYNLLFFNRQLFNSLKYSFLSITESQN